MAAIIWTFYKNVKYLFTLALLYQLLLLRHSHCSESELYMLDPTHQQTYPVETDEVDEKEIDGVEDQILKLLGLPDAPRPSFKHLKENAGPQFMMQLYQEIQKQEGLHDIMPIPEAMMEQQAAPEFRNISVDIDQNQKIEEVDIVISFVNQGSKLDLGIEHEGDKKYYFELDDIPAASELRDAELRLYKTMSTDETHNYFITVFSIDPSPSSARNFDLSLLDTLKVNSSYEGWLVFNVSQAVYHWMDSKQDNLGLYVQVLTLTGEEVLPHRIGIVNRHGEKDKQGFMVAFFKSLQPLTSQIPQIRRPGQVRKKRSASAEGYWDAPGESSRYSRKLCQRKHLYVKFKRLKFDSWIIAPDGYPAFYCEGECSFPLSSHMNATNHAIVQTLVSLIQPQKFPKACCAPKRLASITVLYFDETQNVVMKRYRNMVVQSCGCH